MAAKSHDEAEEMAPDPDEDDLDDLDEVLDEFQSPSTTSKPAPKPSHHTITTTAPSASGPGRPPAASKDVAPGTDEDFAAQLQAGMVNLMSELDSNPDMQKQFEQMMQELMAAGAAPTDAEAGRHLREAAKTVPEVPPASDAATIAQSSTSTSSTQAATSGKKVPPPSAEDFSETIRRTMDRMQQSDATAAATTTSGAGAALSEEDLLAQMMRELQNGGVDGGEEGFNAMLMGMMTQLVNRDILYDPMKELHDKFPAWMEANRSKTGKEELERYEGQQKLVGEIVGRFERPGYADGNEQDREYIVERMQKMQATGSPPPDLVGDMSAAQEALGDLDAGCPTQ